MKILSTVTTSQFWSHCKTGEQLDSPLFKTHCQGDKKSHSDCRKDFFKITFFIIVIHHQPMKSLSIGTISQFWSQFKNDKTCFHQSPKLSAWLTTRVTVTATMILLNNIFQHCHPSPANEKFVNWNHLPILITIQEMTKHVFTKVQNSVPGWQQELQWLQQWSFHNDIFHHCYPSQANEKFATTTTYQFLSQVKTGQQPHSPESKSQCLGDKKSHSDCRNDFFKITCFIIVIHRQPMKSL